MRRSLGATALVGLVAVVAAGCQAVTPPAAVTEQGQQISDLYNLVFAIAAVVFFLVEGLIVWSVIRYRRRPGQNSLPAQTHGNLALELVWTAIPLITVVALFFAHHTGHSIVYGKHNFIPFSNLIDFFLIAKCHNGNVGPVPKHALFYAPNGASLVPIV